MIDEGYIKFHSAWRQSAPLDHPEIDVLIRWRRPLYAAGLVGHFADTGVGYGNISARVPPPGLFVISGTQTGHLAELQREHFALVTACDVVANRVESTGPIEASSESMTHALLYDLDPDIRAVVHVHSEMLWTSLRDSVPTTAAEVEYGTPQMALEFARLYRDTTFRQTGVAVMAGHEGGLITIGSSVQHAAARILDLDKTGSP